MGSPKPLRLFLVVGDACAPANLAVRQPAPVPARKPAPKRTPSVHAQKLRMRYMDGTGSTAEHW